MVYDNPLDILNVFMSFLGHYGVQIFTFLSAYGLMRSIEKQPQVWQKFVFKRMKQLFLPMLLVMVFYLLLDYYFDGIFSARLGEHDLWDVFYRMIFISNLLPGQAVLVIGPWWFLSMIMQFYCFFLLMHSMQLRWGNESLALLSLFSIIVAILVEPWLTQHNYLINATVLGHIPEFALGMYVGSLNKIKVPVWIIIAAGVGLILGNTWQLFWYFAPVCAIIVMMMLYIKLLKYTPENHFSLRALEYVGLLSMYLFLFNGVIREPFLPLAKAVNDPLMSLAYTALVTCLCLITAQGFYSLELYLKKKFQNLRKTVLKEF